MDVDGPHIVDILRGQKAGLGDEIQLADAINIYAQQDTVETVHMSGRRFSVGYEWSRAPNYEYITRTKFNVQKIYPVLLAGGSGTRLWPLSRKSYPKQFSKLFGDKTLFQSSAQRLTSSATLEFAPHITLTNSDYRFIIGEQLQEVGIDPGPILIEPEAKNTAAAILAASTFVHSKDENAIYWLLHLII